MSLNDRRGDEYEPPELIEYGDVEQLTESGYPKEGKDLGDTIDKLLP